MRDRHGPRPVAGAWPGSSVLGVSYCRVWNETIPQLGKVLPDAPVRPLPAMAAGSCGGWGPIGVPDSGDDASLRGGTPPCTAGPINDGSRSRQSRHRGHHPQLPCLVLDRSLRAPAARRLLLHTLIAGSTHPPDSASAYPSSLAPPTRLTPPPSTHSPLAPPIFPPSCLIFAPILWIGADALPHHSQAGDDAPTIKEGSFSGASPQKLLSVMVSQSYKVLQNR